MNTIDSPHERVRELEDELLYQIDLHFQKDELIEAYKEITEIYQDWLNVGFDFPGGETIIKLRSKISRLSHIDPR